MAGKTPPSAKDAGAVRELIAEGRTEDAEALAREILDQNPEDPDTLHGLGIALHAGGRNEEAQAVLADALRHSPGNGQLHYDLGVIEAALGNLEDAIQAWKAAAGIDPAISGALLNLALARVKTGKWTEAEEAAREGAERFPGEAAFPRLLGHALVGQGRNPDAADEYRRALELQPEDAGTWYALGLVARDAGTFDEAKRCFRKTTELAPGMADGHYELAQILLGEGDFKEGFREYEWRLKRPQAPDRDFGVPRWDGSEPEGLKLLLYGEQGHGDTIHFLRYVPEIASRGAKITLAVHESLVPALEGAEGVDRLVPLFDEPDDIDAQAPLMSLAHILGTGPATIPAAVPYIPGPRRPVPAAVKDADGFSVGLVWSGNTAFPANDVRSCGLQAYGPLLETENAAFYSLQLGEPAAELGNHPQAPVHDLAPGISDYADTAAIIAALDLVITTDTSVAHLAGAMGRPVWILLSATPDWRWFRDRPESPWYPTARLFRQHTLGDWSGPMAEAKKALEGAIKEKSG